MRLEPLYRARWTTPEFWSVELAGAQGTEGGGFLLAEGRCEGRIAGRLRAANFPRARVDGVLTPDFRGVLETDDGATILFAWQGYLRTEAAGARQLVGSVTHLSDDERYRRLNDVVCVLAGEVRPGADVAVEVSELVWEPLLG
jgi:Protein of unknown function (DUF3237)